MVRQAKRESGKLTILVIIEDGPENYPTYSPDVPGCVATGKTMEEVVQNMREALEVHLEGLREENLELPTPHNHALELDLVTA